MAASTWDDIERWTLSACSRKLSELSVSFYFPVPLKSFLFSALAILLGVAGLPAAQPQISDDRDLKEFDLSQWPCLNRLEGSARTPDGVERNRLKNRAAPNNLPVTSESLDTAAFLQRVADFDAKTKGKRRKDLNPAEKEELDPLEKQIVRFTGYLVAAYCGPPETTNCASVDFHDWHLELFEKPQDHPPQPGDPTPVICEITPRTQSAIYRDNIRIQELTAFFRRPDLTYESTGHKAQKIRVTGYLMWDDEHNGSADVGTTIRYIAANKFHQPWRSTAWEIHPAFKVERADAITTSPAASPMPATSPPTVPASSPSPSSENTAVPSLTPKPTALAPAPTPQQFVTVIQPVKIKIPYGQTVLPGGAKVPVVSRNLQTVTVEYLGGTYVVPIASTDLQP
jgi:hypothetical protein